MAETDGRRRRGIAPQTVDRQSGLDQDGEDHRGGSRRQKAHPFYKRVVTRSKKFYAHDEEQTAHIGDFVKIEETRPLSQAEALAAEGSARVGVAPGDREPVV